MPTLLTSGLVIEHLAWRVRNYRFLRRGLMEGKLKLSRIGSLAMSARDNIDGLAKDYQAFNDATTEHRADVRGLKDQVLEMRDDLGFSVTTLGNSVASSNAGANTEDVHPPSPSPAIQQPERAPADPGQPNGQQMTPVIVGDQRQFDRMGG